MRPGKQMIDVNFSISLKNKQNMLSVLPFSGVSSAFALVRKVSPARRNTSALLRPPPAPQPRSVFSKS